LDQAWLYVAAFHIDAAMRAWSRSSSWSVPAVPGDPRSGMFRAWQPRV
jgi:hypothetical protein